jgi:predicted TIM-barrel fold metal-dependent hydrolase
MVIDFHTHVFNDAVAQKAIPTLEEKCGTKAHTNGTISDTLEKMGTWGIDKIVVLNIATNPRQESKVNDFAISLNSDKMISFGSVHPLSENWETELERIKIAGLKGIKMHPEYQEFPIDDESVFKIYEKCKELDLIISFHAGKDLGYPNTLMAPPKAIRKVADKFFDNKFVIAHFGGWRVWGDVETYLTDTNLFFDTSLTVNELEPQTMERIIRKKGIDKVLFGSDCPWENCEVAKKAIEALDFTKEEKQMIFFGNAEKLLG